MFAQVPTTFIYEITLFDQFQHKSIWTEREHAIHARHLAYLKALAENGKLRLAGIMDQGLEAQTGFILLTTQDYSEAKEIAMNDPSVKEGMMKVHLRPVNIYFEGKR